MNIRGDFRFMTYRIRMFFQKLFRGFSDADIYNLDAEFVAWVLPRLKRHRAINDSLFPQLDEKATKEVEDKIIMGFEKYLNIKKEDFDAWCQCVDKEYKIDSQKYMLLRGDVHKAIDEAFELFGKYARFLGW